MDASDPRPGPRRGRSASARFLRIRARAAASFGIGNARTNMGRPSGETQFTSIHVFVMSAPRGNDVRAARVAPEGERIAKRSGSRP